MRHQPVDEGLTQGTSLWHHCRHSSIRSFAWPYHSRRQPGFLSNTSTVASFSVASGQAGRLLQHLCLSTSMQAVARLRAVLLVCLAALQVSNCATGCRKARSAQSGWCGLPDQLSNFQGMPQDVPSSAQEPEHAKIRASTP